MTRGLNKPDERNKQTHKPTRSRPTHFLLHATRWMRTSPNSKSLKDCSFISQDTSSESCVIENIESMKAYTSSTLMCTHNSLQQSSMALKCDLLPCGNAQRLSLQLSKPGERTNINWKIINLGQLNCCSCPHGRKLFKIVAYMCCLWGVCTCKYFTGCYMCFHSPDTNLQFYVY